MAADTRNKRTQGERESDRVQIARLYLEGMSPSVIAQKVCEGKGYSLSRQEIVYELKVMTRSWQEAISKDIATAKARELAKLDHLEATYWEAWTRSVEEREIRETRQKQPATGALERRTMMRKEGRDGNPAFLEGVLECIEKRCKIMGLFEMAASESAILIRRWIGVDPDAV